MIFNDMNPESMLNLSLKNKFIAGIAADSKGQNLSSIHMGSLPHLTSWNVSDDGYNKQLHKKLTISIENAIRDIFQAKSSSNLIIRGELTIYIANGNSMTLKFSHGKKQCLAYSQSGPSIFESEAQQIGLFSGFNKENLDKLWQEEASLHPLNRKSITIEEKKAMPNVSRDNSAGYSRFTLSNKLPREQRQQEQPMQTQTQDIQLPGTNFDLLMIGAKAEISTNTDIAPTTTINPIFPSKRKLQPKPLEDIEIHSAPKNARITGSGLRLSSDRVTSRRFACNQCEEVVFNNLRELDFHTLDKHGSYACQKCNSRFTMRSNMQRHALRHLGFRPFLCRLCGHANYRKDHVIRHLVSHHPQDRPPSKNIEVRVTSAEVHEYLQSHHATKQHQQANTEAG